jgi:hypothetical protein
MDYNMRRHCVICNSNELKFTYSLKEFPMTFLPTDEAFEEDIFLDLNLYGCEKCGCVQLKNLLDPNVLYGTPHNLTYNTPLWKEHHRMFCDYIYDGKQSNDILEIGGYSGVLAKLLLEKDSSLNYTILDICDTDPKIENVKFINGNCETYDFKEDTTIVMSHVFEHLYEPSKFIENLKRNSVKNVFISIPNMNAQMETRTVPIVQQEHTFFCDYNDIVHLFSKSGYLCLSSFYFKNQSIFFQFIQCDTLNTITQFNKERIDNYHNVYKYNQLKISSLKDLDTSFFIVPAGLYGQIIYYFLNPEYKKNLLGFLDNDPSKINRRLYGTQSFIYKMDEIKKYETITIILYNGPYTKEIMTQLDGYNKKIRYILLD